MLALQPLSVAPIFRVLRPIQSKLLRSLVPTKQELSLHGETFDFCIVSLCDQKHRISPYVIFKFQKDYFCQESDPLWII